MAKPAFIYAFDNLGDERFVELCGSLLASRYRNFLLGGVGADGGIDATVDEVFGEWHPEDHPYFVNEIIEPGETVVFQFKHVVTARTGQSNSRSQLMSFYKCTSSKKCELHKALITAKNPSVYVLVTNVEVNSNFRERFIAQCKEEQPSIKHYQIIGLDELEAWINAQPQLGYLYFPTIFGLPRLDLRIDLQEGFAAPTYGNVIDLDNTTEMFQVVVRNVGLVPSYLGSISSVRFKVLADGDAQWVQFLQLEPGKVLDQINPKPGSALEPGRSQTYHIPFITLGQLGGDRPYAIPVEVAVVDEIGNLYTKVIPEDLRNKLLQYMYPSKE